MTTKPTTEPTRLPPIDDETVMAFADGELDETATARVLAAMEQDPALMARVEMFMETRERVRPAFAAVLDAAVPERLLRTLGATSATDQPAASDGATNSAPAPIAENNPAPSATGSGDVVPFRKPEPRQGKVSGTRTSSGSWRPMLLAASLALVAAGLITVMGPGGLLPGGQTVSRPGHAIAALYADTRGLDALLTTTRDGAAATLAGSGLAITPSGTYRVGDQRICRTVEARHAESRTAAEALACRQESGQWRIDVAIDQPLDGAAGAGGFRPASGAPNLDTFLDALQAGQPLSGPEVESLILRKWR